MCIRDSGGDGILIISMTPNNLENFKLICDIIIGLVETDVGIKDLPYKLPLTSTNIIIKESYPHQYQSIVNWPNQMTKDVSFEFAPKVIYNKGVVEIECSLIHCDFS